MDHGDGCVEVDIVTGSPLAPVPFVDLAGVDDDPIHVEDDGVDEQLRHLPPRRSDASAAYPARVALPHEHQAGRR